jgi:hypothetical protein
LEGSRSKDFVVIAVSLPGGDILVLMMSKEYALTVEGCLRKTNTPETGAVPLDVSPKSKGNQEVYNITVDGEHVYYANGVLVKNCSDALRYAIFTHFAPIYHSGGERSLEDYRRWKLEHGWQ